MRLEKLNENKLKIIFDAKELEENNISVHSFLSNSIESQKLFLAILEIANEDLGFDAQNSKLTYEAFSFNNMNFVIFITKSGLPSFYNNLSNLDFEKYNDIPFSIRDINPSNTSGFNFSEESFCNTSAKSNKFQSLIYFFDSIEDFFEFSDFFKSLFTIPNLKNSLYQYNDIFFIEIETDNLSSQEFSSILANISEIKNSYFLTELAKAKFKEYSNLLLKDNAIQEL